MIYSLKQTLHIPRRCRFCKRLIGLLSDLFEKLSTGDVFHDQVNVFLIVVGLVILYDIRMVKGVQDGDFLHDAVNIIAKFDLVKHLYGDLEVFVMLIRSEENASKSANT